MQSLDWDWSEDEVKNGVKVWGCKLWKFLGNLLMVSNFDCNFFAKNFKNLKTEKFQKLKNRKNDLKIRKI